MSRARTLIVNADDFGLTGGVSRGILEAHRRGIVTSTTMIVTRPVDPASIEALRASGLGVGLHLNLTLGAPIADPRRVPSLVDADGKFVRDAPAAAARAVKDEARIELGNQIDAFRRAMGRFPTHLDSHHHVARYEPILEVMLDAKLTMVELAVDFSAVTNVTQNFVLRFGVFGKSKRDLSGDNRIGDWWGARKGGKRTKSYFKHQVFGHRVEFVLKSRFLRHYGIRDVFDFRRFNDLLPRRHILFARLDEQRLIARLRGAGFSGAKTIDILRRVAQKRDLCAALQYLRRKVGIKNSRRLLVPLHTNKLIQQALTELAAEWPAAPARLSQKR